ncbi:MAG: NUDIX hydrolase [Cyclobacteriaceae bacterium]|nr:NUDIX hydrolase [Cyclobacteriaceae bacterium]
MQEIVKSNFGGRVRLRVCGLLIEDNKILLVEHSGLNESKSFWIPPGGGLNFGEKLEKALEREFLEETGIKIKTKELLFCNQHINLPLHAVELFFSVEKIGGTFKKGIDPELSDENQIIRSVKYVTIEKLLIIPDENKHEILKDLINFESILKKTGLLGLD